MTTKVFLSASVPLPTRDPQYFRTADPIAIREAVKALALVAVEKEVQVVFGGHPAITPMISNAFSKAGRNPREYMFLYQSAFFEGLFPAANADFGTYVVTPAVRGDRDASLAQMRTRIFEDYCYRNTIFIGGMDGCLDEHGIARRLQPDAISLPVASTGGASKIIYEEFGGDPRLAHELTYQTLFRELLD